MNICHRHQVQHKISSQGRPMFHGKKLSLMFVVLVRYNEGKEFPCSLLRLRSLHLKNALLSSVSGSNMLDIVSFSMGIFSSHTSCCSYIRLLFSGHTVFFIKLVMQRIYSHPVFLPISIPPPHNIGGNMTGMRPF